LISESTSNSDKLADKILEFAKEGVTKKDIMDKFALSRPRVRRLTADLVNKGFLSQHVSSNLLMTTARGNIHLRKISSKRQSSNL
jgi:predicted HTH transcriptional regulator